MAAGCRIREKNGKKPPTRYFSDKQEKAVAKSTGSTQTPNSGATAWVKGDCLSEEWLIECKTKTQASESISIKKEWIAKNAAEAVQMGKKYTTIAFSFGPDQDNYYIIDEFLFQDLMEYLKSKDNG